MAKKILEHYKKVRTKFIPPMLQLPGGLNFIKWQDSFLPEIVWIGLLQEKLGTRCSVEICRNINKAAKKVCGDKIVNLSFISNYKKLNSAECAALSYALKSNKILVEILYALEPLLILYPECPLKNVFITNDLTNSRKELINDFKKSLEKYFYRREHLSNLIEATSLWMAIDAGHLKYCSTVTPPDLELLITQAQGSQDYEKTACKVRAAALSLMKDVDVEWSKYFWKRGLEIDECEK